MTARACQARHHGALHARRHQDDPQVMSPLDRIIAASSRKARAARLKRGSRAASIAGGRGHLPRPRTGMAPGQCRPCQPRPTEGDVGDRELPHGGARRSCRALRGLRPHARSRTTPAATGIARSARARRQRTGWPRARPICCRCRTIMSCSHCRRPSPISPTRTRPSSTTCCSRPRPRP